MVEDLANIARFFSKTCRSGVSPEDFPCSNLLTFQFALEFLVISVSVGILIVIHSRFKYSFPALVAGFFFGSFSGLLVHDPKSFVVSILVALISISMYCQFVSKRQRRTAPVLINLMRRSWRLELPKYWQLVVLPFAIGFLLMLIMLIL